MITISEHIEALQRIVKDNPEYKDLPIVYAVDSEGNSFSEVFFTAMAGHIENSEFTPTPELGDDKKINCICIN